MECEAVRMVIPQIRRHAQLYASRSRIVYYTYWIRYRSQINLEFSNRMQFPFSTKCQSFRLSPAKAKKSSQRKSNGNIARGDFQL